MKATLSIQPQKLQTDGYSFERRGYYMSAKGIVIIYVINWKTNNAPIIFTDFKTVAHGKVVSESWDTASFTDKELQCKAARFLNKALLTST